MRSYYCILNTPGVPTREIAVLKATNDAGAAVEARRLAHRWPGFETVVVYEGERLVTVLSNPLLGFAAEPLDLPDQAA